MKNILTILLLCATVILISCQQEESMTPVSGVTINKTALALTLGAKETLIAAVLPNNATNKRVVWSSSNTSIATVSSNGELVALSAGTTTIRAVSVDDENKTAHCEVTVTGSVIAVTEVQLNKQTLSLLVGTKETLIATVLPNNATNKRVVWSSSNTSIATVSSNGELVALSAGTTTIRAVSVDDENKTAHCEVTVTGSVIAVTEVQLNKQTLSLLVGAKETLIATVLPENATNKNITWESSNPAVATVTMGGEISVLALGTTTITAVSLTDNTKKASCLLTVLEPAVAVTLVGINNKPLSLLVGNKETLLVTVLPDNATDKSVTWRSSDESVATVSTTGEVVSVGTGVATITVASVSDNTKTDECVVTVTAPVVTTAAIGNFYYSDHTQTRILDKTKSCVGVVFWVDPDNNQKGKIVSLDEEELVWALEKFELTGANNNTNGRANMYTLNKFVRDSRNSVWGDYHAFNWVATVKNKRLVGGWDDTDMWCLPAQGDLVALWGLQGATMMAVNVSLNSISSAVPLTTNFYCSSTEKDDLEAIFVSFSTGLSQGFFKFSENKVRAIAAF